MTLPKQTELDELETLLNAPTKLRPVVVHHNFSTPLMRTLIMRAQFLCTCAP
jgi:hypothetical protein